MSIDSKLKFIKRAEVLAHIKENVLDGVTEDNDILLIGAEMAAICEIDGYIGAKYNTEEIFNKKGNSRNAFIKTVVIDIMVFNLYSRTSTDVVPSIKEQRYAKAIEWLNDTAKGKTAPNLPIRAKEFGYRSNEMLSGQMRKINNAEL